MDMLEIGLPFWFTEAIKDFTTSQTLSFGYLISEKVIFKLFFFIISSPASDPWEAGVSDDGN